MFLIFVPLTGALLQERARLFYSSTTGQISFKYTNKCFIIDFEKYISILYENGGVIYVRNNFRLY
jgi:hypothetical protein